MTPSAAGSNKPRILLVEDEAIIVKMVGKALEVAGFEVLVATDGQFGLDQARAARPDAIVLDLMLPKLDGYQVCDALKRDPAFQAIPIIIYTGKSVPGDEQRCRQLGANGYVSKSQGSAALIPQLRALLGAA